MADAKKRTGFVGKVEKWYTKILTDRETTARNASVIAMYPTVLYDKIQRATNRDLDIVWAREDYLNTLSSEEWALLQEEIRHGEPISLDPYDYPRGEKHIPILERLDRAILMRGEDGYWDERWDVVLEDTDESNQARVDGLVTMRETTPQEYLDIMTYEEERFREALAVKRFLNKPSRLIEKVLPDRVIEVVETDVSDSDEEEPSE